MKFGFLVLYATSAAADITIDNTVRLGRILLNVTLEAVVFAR
jgi:hypothetical protein